MSLRLRPVTLGEARAYVAREHRHNDPPTGHRVSVGIEDAEGVLRGVAIAGHPIARKSDDGRTLEIYRVATDGARNGCSLLYGAMRRAAWALGYQRIITYTLEAEPGSSLRAAGYLREGSAGGGEWAHTAGPRSADKPTLFYEAKMPTGPKVRWAAYRKGSEVSP